MQKKILLTCCLLPLTCSPVQAHLRPLVSLAIGSDRANVYSTKSIGFIDPFQNAYIGRNHFDTETVFGVFLGSEMAFFQDWNAQLGLSYYQNSGYTPQGSVWQFSSPTFHDLDYQYQIQSRRAYVESKLSRAFRKIWHPYIALGVGEALNRSYGYSETGVDSTGVPMSVPFASHTNHAFTWLAGIGVDVDLQTHLRVGAGYRFMDLGSASLGTSSLQIHNNTISINHIHTGEFIAQLTVID